MGYKIGGQSSYNSTDKKLRDLVGDRSLTNFDELNWLIARGYGGAEDCDDEEVSDLLQYDNAVLTNLPQGGFVLASEAREAKLKKREEMKNRLQEKADNHWKELQA